MKALFYKILPYTIAIIFGVMLFVLVRVVEHTNPNMSDLLMNISADFLSIPLVFITYEVVSRMCNRDLQLEMFRSVTFAINGVVLNVVKDMRLLIGLDNNMTSDDLTSFLAMGNKALLSKLSLEKHLDDDLLADLKKNKENLRNILYKKTTLEALDTDSGKIKGLLNLLKNIDIMYARLSSIENRNSISTTAKSSVAGSMDATIHDIGEWLDNFETDALIRHQNVKIVE